MTRKRSREEAIEGLWRQGYLFWKLDSCQKKMYELTKTSTSSKVVVNVSRRVGKSFFLLVTAVEIALQKPNSNIKYACPTADQAKKIIRENMLPLFKDCPVDLKPEYVKSERCFYFKNGSIIQIEGVNEGNSEKIRGTSCHFGILDEAGEMDDLEYVITSIFLPQMLTTRGKIVICSTPSKKNEHPFNTKIISQAIHGNFYIKKSIYEALDDIKNDPPETRRLTPEIAEFMKEESGGEFSEAWRREYLCEIIRNEARSVIPEFSDVIEKRVVKEWPTPEKRDCYVSMDLGFTDFTGVLFAYLDFKNAKLIIQDELLLNGQEFNTKILAESIKDKEKELWEEFAPYMRVSDNDPLTLNDLDRLHNLRFFPTLKQDKESAINEVRLKIASEQIIIDPKCKELIYQIRTGSWTKNRKTFERNEKSGHQDLLDALIYLVRNVQWYKNPYPVGWGISKGFDIFSKNVRNLSQSAEIINKLLNIKK